MRCLPHRPAWMAAHQRRRRLSLGCRHRNRGRRLPNLARHGRTGRPGRMISPSVPLSVNPGPFYGVTPTGVRHGTVMQRRGAARRGRRGCGHPAHRHRDADGCRGAAIAVARAGAVSVSVASAAFTCASAPLIVRLVVPVQLIAASDPLAVSRPAVSDTVTVKLSPLVLPLSGNNTPMTAVA